MAYDDQASPTNVKPQPASRGNSGRAMGDIDAAASPSGPSSPNVPDGHPLPSLTNANYGGINSIVEVSMAEQVPGSTVTMDNHSFNDDVAQYRKAGRPTNPHNEALRTIRNQAYEYVGETQDNSNPPFCGLQDSDPQGG